jgi:4-hydroxy-tetrahydrodipicolinate reductase
MDTIQLMINGLPGNVAGTICRHAVTDDRLTVLPYSLTGPDVAEKSVSIEGLAIELVKPEGRAERMRGIMDRHGAFITVDYTHPTAVDANVEFYCSMGLPFVLGTTGGDREGIRQRVQESDISAVIAPNMAKQIVGLMAMVEYGAKTFPGLFSGFSLTVNESHQSWKADTSGTAKAMVRYFNELGIPFTEDRIQKERDPEIQKNEWKIPEEHLDGHGWHTYTLTAPDSSSLFSITHNISGRDIYAGGTFDAALYLNKKITSGIKGRVFSMIDVLKKN